MIIIVPSSSCSASSPLLCGHSLEPDMPTPPQLPFSFTAPQSGTGHAHPTPATLLLYCPTVWNRTCPPNPNYPFPLLTHSLEPDMPTPPQLPLPLIAAPRQPLGWSCSSDDAPRLPPPPSFSPFPFFTTFGLLTCLFVLVPDTSPL